MSLVYDDKPYSGPPIPYHKINANKSWLKHLENWLYLRFLEKNGNAAEKRQAGKELIICQRKMSWMEKHSNFDWALVIPEKKKLERTWKSV